MLEETRIKEACAKYLGIDTSRITSAHSMTDGGGRFAGVQVEIFIRPGYSLESFLEKHAPQQKSA